MKSEFKAKYLQHLVRKNKGNEGFTLIELLVVIIIVGVLAAIALPSFLNQIGKARGSEAKSSIGTINRSQQGYRLENNSFAPSLTYLDSKVTGKFYTFSVAATDKDNASSTATIASGQATDLKLYTAAVQQNGDAFYSTICESLSNNSAPANAVTSSTGGSCTASSAKKVD